MKKKVCTKELCRKMGALLQKFLCGNERTNENSILE